MPLTIHSKYKYFDSTVQRAEDRRQKFHFCRLPFAVNVMLNLSIVYILPETKSRGIFTNIHEPEANNCFSIITQVIIEIIWFYQLS